MNQKTLIPISILIAGILIAAAVFYSNRQPGGSATPADGTVAIEVSPVDENDWIRGNVDAQIKLIEFSDTECPFCKGFHTAMNQIITEYDPGEVAWVYRHLPLTQIHPKAGLEAIALECAGELGGQDGFWNYTNQIYEETPSNNNLDLDRLPEIAVEQGLDRTAFEACLNDDKHKESIQKDLDDAFGSAVHLGSNPGTPYTVLISENELNEGAIQALKNINTKYGRNRTLVYISDDGKRATISGNIPKEDITSALDAALSK